MSKRKICIVVASRANYGRVKFLMKAIEEHSGLQLQLIVGASTLLDRFGNAINIIKSDGFVPIRSIHYIVEGENLITQAKSTGLGIVELSTAFADIQPDMVVTVADRFETMATAIASTYLNIPLIHIQGGEISGNIDDRVRHAITKLSDIHFVATEQSRKRVISMGEDENYVFNYGCPSIDVLSNNDLRINNKLMDKYNGVGVNIDWGKPYILLIQHPVTTSFGDGYDQITKTLEALKNISGYQKVVLWPNIDAGSDDVACGIRNFRERMDKLDPFGFYKNFSPEDYARVLNNSSCCIGNSSSFIREGSFLGIPSVIIGNRQNKREHGKNIVFADHDTMEITKKIRSQLGAKKYESEKIFGVGDAGKRIADKLYSISLDRLLGA